LDRGLAAGDEGLAGRGQALGGWDQAVARSDGAPHSMRSPHFAGRADRALPQHSAEHPSCARWTVTLGESSALLGPPERARSPHATRRSVSGVPQAHQVDFRESHDMRGHRALGEWQRCRARPSAQSPYSPCPTHGRPHLRVSKHRIPHLLGVRSLAWAPTHHLPTPPPKL
jgi:hypothetical protein